MSIIVVNLQDNQAVFRIFIALLRLSFDFPPYFSLPVLQTHYVLYTTILPSFERK